ncbi:MULTISPECIES: histidine kinase [Bacillus]|uniref:Histidine kinase n=1 Tax=Bacillus wiedmannii TaxID=1890302 RepID=A0A2A8BH80_9BACI|nr:MULTISPECIES: histidine kinase [Bacillus]OUB87018.1 histidine kinase [Bacillus thuringiensis serovar sinensis]MBY7111846.1 histidine kinase [Bacillus sp. 17RED48]MBY7121616.1 histidine kinase [Bacillus sp. 16GRE42]MCU5111755.1 histidine kinase [Bacillus wiedmannii]MCU5151193.1 histidine kinase [Bacillus wiedmannii]
MRINLLSILFLLFFTSCSPLNDNEVASVKPYKLTKEQSEILQMTPIGAGNRMFYNVALKNNNDELHATIEYYQNGKKVKEITNIASSHFLEKKIRLSFIAPYFHFDKDVQEKGQWYINIDGGSTLVPQDALLGINSSATTTIQSTKNLKYNQKTILAAVIQTSKETVSVPTIDEDSGIDILLKENEHVYLFSIELKKEH